MTSMDKKSFKTSVYTKITIYTALWLVLAFIVCTVIVYKTNLTNINHIHSDYTHFIIYTLMIVVVVIAVCVAIHLTIQQILAKPLKRLIDSFQEINSSSFNCDTLPLYEDNEIGALAIAFNSVLKRSCDRTKEMAEEIIERKKMERKLDIKIEQQLIVAQLGQLALSGMPIDELMNVIVTSIAEILNIEYCKILKLSSDNESLSICADIDWHGNLVKNTTISIGLNSQAGYTLLSDEPVIVDDLRTEVRFDGSQLLNNQKIISGISVKINAQQSTWGVLSAHTVKKRKFTQEDINFILVIANCLAVAIQNKTAEKALKTSEERFQLMTEHIDDMLWLCTADGMEMLYVSPAYEKITGRTVESFYQDPNLWLNDIHTEDLPNVIKNFATNGIKGKSFTTTFRICRLDGETRTVCDTGFPIFDDNGNLYRIAGTVKDITQQKKAEEKLAKLKLLYEYILHSAGEGIYGLDLNGDTTFINPAALNMLGYETHELTGKSQHDTVHHSHIDGTPYAEEDCPISKAIKDRRVHKADDEVFWRKDKTSFPVEYVSTPILDSRNNLTGAVVMFRDISNKKQMESELQMAQKLEAVGQLAAGIAHEINTPAQYVGDNIRFLNDGCADLISILSDFKNLLDLCINKTLTDDHIKQINEAIEKADLDYLLEEIPLALKQSQEGIESISSIVKAMKEFSHPGSDDKDLVDLNHIIKNTVAVTKNEWKYVADMTLDLDKNLPSVPCYAQQLGQVFMNLIINASYAIADVIDDKTKKLGNITISSKKQNDVIVIRITDSGKGIPENIVDKIFDPFFTTKGIGKGTGQGLAIARSTIIDKHLGSLKCDSSEGVGTTFIIELPLADTKADYPEIAA